ncbi:hypothetical protein [Kineosporia sp. A_224]|uniref:hypothetical protein n=1 Tax=Kineosporia sp. A_224 TaxID=1962180 RepID=UPI000B4BF865|nr:hypothetical protein [Kineosporia sp. A_224]
MPGGRLPVVLDGRGRATRRFVDVYAAVEQPEARHRWLRLPGRPEPTVDVELRPGATEILRSTLTVGDRAETVERRTHVLEALQGERLVLSYQAVVDGVCRWVSLVTVVTGPSPGTGTTLGWTEQYAFLRVTGDGGDDVAHLRGGTRLMLTGLALALGLVPRPAEES